MTHRTKQVESTLKRVISQVLQRELADPRVEGLVSITHVKISPDLRHADVFVSVLPASAEQKVLAGLTHASGHVQSLIRKRVAMRHVPHVEFQLDDSLKRQAAVFEAIQRGLERSGTDILRTDPDEDPRLDPSAAPPDPSRRTGRPEEELSS